MLHYIEHIVGFPPHMTITGYVCVEIHGMYYEVFATVCDHCGRIMSYSNDIDVDEDVVPQNEFHSRTVSTGKLIWFPSYPW